MSDTRAEITTDSDREIIEIISLEGDDLERFEALAMCISTEEFSEERRRGS